MPRQQLHSVAALAAAKKARTSTKPAPRVLRKAGEVLDMKAEFEQRGSYIRELTDGKHAVTCPWAEEHSSNSGISETVIFEPREEGATWGFRCQHSHCAERTIKDVWQLFRSEQPEKNVKGGLSIEDFAYVAPQDKFLCLPTRELWARVAVNTCFPVGRYEIRTSTIIAGRNRAEQMSWLPGKPEFVEDFIVNEGGFTSRAGYRIANLWIWVT